MSSSIAGVAPGIGPTPPSLPLPAPGPVVAVLPPGQRDATWSPLSMNRLGDRHGHVACSTLGFDSGVPPHHALVRPSSMDRDDDEELHDGGNNDKELDGPCQIHQPRTRCHDLLCLVFCCILPVTTAQRSRCCNRQWRADAILPRPPLLQGPSSGVTPCFSTAARPTMGRHGPAAHSCREQGRCRRSTDGGHREREREREDEDEDEEGDGEDGVMQWRRWWEKVGKSNVGEVGLTGL